MSSYNIKKTKTVGITIKIPRTGTLNITGLVINLEELTEYFRTIHNEEKVKKKI